MAEMCESNIKYVWECGTCKSEFHVSKQRIIEGRACPFCRGPLIPKYVQGTDYSSDKDITTSQVKVDIDVADALKGLKAVQREAKKAIKLLDELEEKQKDINALSNKTIEIKIDGERLGRTLGRYD